MPRRWLNSADVEINQATGAILVESACDSRMTPPTSMTGGSKTVTPAATAQALVATSTPCRCVWIGPLCNTDGVGTNTKPVFLGNSVNQNMPLLPNAISGVVISIDDASKIYVKVGVNGEGVAYRIFA